MNTVINKIVDFYKNLLIKYYPFPKLIYDRRHGEISHNFKYSKFRPKYRQTNLKERIELLCSYKISLQIARK